MFEKFMKQVDRELAKITDGAVSSHLEIADWNWADAFEDGETAEDAVMQALEADDLFAIFPLWD